MCIHLGTKAFWVDESIAVLPARSIHFTGLPRSPFDLNYMSHQLEDGLWDPSAPLYRYSVAAFTAVAGFDEWTTRGWSVLMGLALLAPCFLLFRRLYGETTAWIAIAILATLPSFAEHCREARHFTFVLLMMYTTFWLVVRATGKDGLRARAWWPLALTATVLGHYVGYMVVPIVAVYLLASWPRPFLTARYAALYVALFVGYAALQAKYWNTLPFFHSIGCHNRHPGCEPSPFYYFGTILEFLGGGSRFWETIAGTDPFLMLPNLGPVVLLMVGGIVLTILDAGRGRWRAGHVLVLAAFWIPLILLSTQELKFPRYMFYILPVMCLFVARAVVAVSGARRLGPARRPVLAAAFLLVLVGPEIVKRSDGYDVSTSLETRFGRHVQRMLDDDSADTWQRTLAQVDYLKQHMIPGDIVTTSFDDASLGYYLGQFVHGFLNNEHDDEYFLGLLQEAKARGRRVHFIDMLPEQNYCHTKGVEVFSIDCRQKYPQFYAACHPRSPAHDSSCVRQYFR
ncbi:MAG TPA: glycosyltransferase family 39 protein [Candidatus Binatia bacterium]|nr:glycosyltransferase family 39 protein [Candidatus Binatia bacterium]